jgi:hypothetical protein
MCLACSRDAILRRQDQFLAVAVLHAMQLRFYFGLRSLPRRHRERVAKMRRPEPVVPPGAVMYTARSRAKTRAREYRSKKWPERSCRSADDGYVELDLAPE